MRTISTAVLVGVLLSGCAFVDFITFKPVPRWTPLPFDEEAYRPYGESGTGTVRGQVFAKTFDGEVKKGAGNFVRLIPATAYGKQWILSSGPPSTPPDPRYWTYTKVRRADAEGRFAFAGVPPGRYYVYSEVTWQTIPKDPERRRPGVYDDHGGEVWEVVTVANDNVTEAMLVRSPD